MFSQFFNGVNGAAPATPYDPATDPNFVAVWESTSGVASTLGVVSSWTDRVASIVASGGVGHQPSIVTNQINTSLPVIRLTNTVSYQNLIPPATNIIPNSEWSVFVVIRPTLAGIANYGGFMGLTFPTIGMTSGMVMFSSSPTGGGSYGPGPFFGGNTGGSGWGSNGGFTPTSFTYNTTSFECWGWTYAGGGLGSSSNFTFTQNFSSLPLMTALNALFDPSANTLGDFDTAGANSFNGDIAAIYLANVAVSGSELTKFQNYITTKWGV